MRAPRSKKSGVTLVEMMVVGSILMVVVVGLSLLIKQSAQGLSSTDKMMGIQRDLLRAQDRVLRDFNSSGRGSFMNLLPNAGFETFVFVPPTQLPSPAPSRWIAPLDVIDPLASQNTVSSRIIANRARSGSGALLITSFGAEHHVDSPVFTGLEEGQVYLVSGWVYKVQAVGGFEREGGIQVLGDAVSMPSTIRVSSRTASRTWAQLSSTFTAVAGRNYVIRLGVDTVGFGSPPVLASFLFDDLTLTPLGVDLTPGNPAVLEFERRDATNGNRWRLRYFLTVNRGSGTLVRQRLDPDGVWRTLEPNLPNIRRLSVSWQNGEADTILGTQRPLLVQLEAGPSDGNEKFIATSFLTSLGAP
ncbi:MAG: type II secretion system protein [Elusimicrobia bacterium]|nr:type II secretion system protein [Elusimicrobiota bacterium]